MPSERLQQLTSHFDRVAPHYDQVAQCQQQIADQLCDRLTSCAISPKRILDLGSGTGYLASKLQQYYPDAMVVVLDHSLSMLQQTPLSLSPVGGDFNACPFHTAGFDMVVSNMALHWACDLQPVLHEINRLLSPGGVLMFAMAGPNTCVEWQQAWADIDHHAHVLDFVEPGRVAQWLLDTGFAEPVVDTEEWVMMYPSWADLRSAMKQTGVGMPVVQRPGLLGRAAYQRLQTSYARHCDGAGQWPLTYEVIMGYARAAGVGAASNSPGEAYVSVDQIRRPGKR